MPSMIFALVVTPSISGDAGYRPLNRRTTHRCINGRTVA
jgi:hypothetical protein